MRGQAGWKGLIAIMVFAVAACAGDADEQATPADDADTIATPAQPTTPQSTVGANVQLPEGVTQDMVAQGEQIFNQQICFSCHGENGTGTPLGPALTDEEWLNIDGSYENIINVVRTGVDEPVQHPAPMPPMGGIQLTDEQIQQVSAYVYALSRGG